MGSGSQNVTSNYSQNQTYSANPATQQFSQGVIGLANSLPGASQVPLQGISPWNPQQAQAYANYGTLANANPANPYFNAGNNYVSQSASPQSVLGNQSLYYNQFANQVMAQLQNLYGMQQSQNTGNLVQAAGGVGADRVAVGQGVLANQQALATGQILSGLSQNAQQSALQTAGLQQGAGALSYAAGPAALQSMLSGNAALFGSGASAQQQAQNLLNAYFQQQTGQYQNPFQVLGANTSVLGTLAPALGGSTNTQGQQQTTYPAPSMLSQIAGAGLSGLGLLGQTGAFGGTGKGGGSGNQGWFAPMMSGLGSGLNSGLSSMSAKGASALGMGPFLALARGGGINPYSFADGGSVVPFRSGNVPEYMLEQFNIHQPGGYESDANKNAVASGVMTGKVKVLRPEGKAGGGGMAGYPMPTGYGNSDFGGVGDSIYNTVNQDILGKMIGGSGGLGGSGGMGSLGGLLSSLGSQAKGGLGSLGKGAMPGGMKFAQGGPIRAADGMGIPAIPGIPDVTGGQTDASPYYLTPQMQRLQMLRMMMMPSPMGPLGSGFRNAAPGLSPRPPSFADRFSPANGLMQDPSDPTAAVESATGDRAGAAAALRAYPPASEASAPDEATTGNPLFYTTGYGQRNQPALPPTMQATSDPMTTPLTASGAPAGGRYIPGSADALMPPDRPPPSTGGFSINPLLAAGLGILAASGQRDARGLPMTGLGAIGAGGLRGITLLEEQRKQALAEKAEYDRNYMEAQRILQQSQFHEDPYNRLTAEQMTTPVVIGMHTDFFGNKLPVYGMRNAKGEITPIAGQATPGQDDSNLDLNKPLPNAAAEKNAQAIAHYQLAPITGWGLYRQAGAMTQARAESIAQGEGEEYDAKYFHSTQKTFDQFFGGSPTGAGTNVRRFGVSIAHLDTLQQVADALKNGDTAAINRLKNVWQREFGSSPMPTNYDAATGIIRGEITSAIIGARGALGDREEAEKSLDKNLAPDLQHGTIDMYKRLMASQIEGYKRQLEGGVEGSERGKKIAMDKFNTIVGEHGLQVLKDFGTGGIDASMVPGGKIRIPEYMNGDQAKQWLRDSGIKSGTPIILPDGTQGTAP